MCQMLLRTFYSRRFLLAALLAAYIGHGLRPANAEDKEMPALQLSSKENRVLKGLERKLSTKLSSQDNPADRDTWYVLLFLDRAIAQAQSPGVRTTWLAEKPGAVMVQGKRPAALALLQFLAGTNDAAVGLSGMSSLARNPTAQGATDKQWQFRAFKTSEDAQMFLLSVLPVTVKSR